MAGTALGGEGIQVKITNDGTQDIVVTVYDMNAQPKKILLQNARITGSRRFPTPTPLHPSVGMTILQVSPTMRRSMYTPIRAAAFSK